MMVCEFKDYSFSSYLYHIFSYLVEANNTFHEEEEGDEGTQSSPQVIVLDYSLNNPSNDEKEGGETEEMEEEDNSVIHCHDSDNHLLNSFKSQLLNTLNM